MKKLLAALVVLVVITTVAGCIEPKEASAARVDEGVLAGAGWVQEGDVQKQTMEVNVTLFTLEINTAMLAYKDKELQDIIRRHTAGLSDATSYMMTLRVVFPLNIVPPSDMVLDAMEGQFLESVRENAPDVQQTEVKTIQIDAGYVAHAKIYEGTVHYDGGSMKIRGILAIWDDGESIIVVGAVVPLEDVTLLGIPIVKIDGEAEFREVITLIQSVA
ncbi:MAG: hypothetical protein LRZ87_04300 [Methanocellales archaeon]|nr:hypothetical protein [Methanocellales archaeon]